MTKILKYIVPFFALLVLCFAVQAQEALFPLHSNPAIKSYLQQQHPSKDQKNARIDITDTLLPLPFIDDFSYDGIYPTNVLWSDKDVFVNRDFPVNPPTIGVATFEGLNSEGDPYNPTGNSDDIADHLTSRYINLPPGDTSVWLSFLYQPQGLGEQPDAGDSVGSPGTELEFAL